MGIFPGDAIPGSFYVSPMRRVLRTTLLSLIAFSAVGCGGNLVNIQQGSTGIVVRNQSDEPICYFYLSEASSGVRQDRLGTTETLDPGSYREYDLDAGLYNLRFEDCREEVIMERQGIMLEEGDRLEVDFRGRE